MLSEYKFIYPKSELEEKIVGCQNSERINLILNDC
jgi:hypothetical protein